MKRFTDAVRSAVATKNWYGALAMALTLPDVCGRLEQPTVGSGARYAQWFGQWVQPIYTHLVGAAREPHVFLSGADCYALRCSYLHEGGGDIAHQRARQVLDDFHFITPPQSGMVHCNQANSTLQLQVDIFCGDVAAAVDRWAASVVDDQDIQTRMKDLLVIHDSSGGIVF